MRKYSAITSIAISALILIIGYIAYVKIIEPVYTNYNTRSISFSFTGSTSTTIHKYEKQDGVFGIELELTGTSHENIELDIGNGEQRIHQVKIKKGEIDYVYKNDWYSDSCILTIISTGNKTCSLNLDYRFLSLD